MNDTKSALRAAIVTFVDSARNALFAAIITYIEIRWRLQPSANRVSFIPGLRLNSRRQAALWVHFGVVSHACDNTHSILALLGFQALLMGLSEA